MCPHVCCLLSSAAVCLSPAVSVQTGDFNNDGHGEMIVIGLFSSGSPPMYGAGAVTLFEPLGLDPEQPWNGTMLSGEFNVVHNAVAVNKPGGGGGQNLLISCQQGLILFDVQHSDAAGWTATPTVLYAANFSDPADGAEVRADDPMRFYHGTTAFDYARSPPYYVGAVDFRPDSYLDDPSQPWHGDSVVLYSHAGRVDQSVEELLSPGLTRTVLYLGRTGGQSVKLADMDRDGCTDMVVGYRGAYGRKLLLFQVQSRNSTVTFPACGDAIGRVPSFTQQVLSERGASMVALADYDSDGFPDVAAVGWGQAGDSFAELYASRYAAWILSTPGGLPVDPTCVATASKLAWQFVALIVSGVAGLAIAVAVWQWSKLRRLQNPQAHMERKKSNRDMLAGSPDTLRMRMLK